MDSITLSSGARSSIVALARLNSQIATVQARMASGRKVNSPIDNPSSFFTAASLSSQASRLNTLLDGISNAVSTINAASSAIGSIQSLVTQAQTLANNALQSNASSLVTITGTRSGLAAGTTISSGPGSSTRFKAGDTVTVSDGTTTATYTAGGNDTVQTFLDAINNTAGLKVGASLSGGEIVLTATDAVNVTIGGSINGAGGGTLSSIAGLTAGATNFVTNSTRSSYATQFNSVLSQINSLATDATFNGVNLLTGGSTTATFDQDGSSTYTVQGVTATSSGLGLSTVSGNFQTDSGINAALGQVAAALTSLQAASSSFGTASTVLSTRADFTTSLVGFLSGASDSLTATDTSQDGAELLALQAQQQIAETTLTLTASADSNVLKLFGVNAGG